METINEEFINNFFHGKIFLGAFGMQHFFSSLTMENNLFAPVDGYHVLMMEPFFYKEEIYLENFAIQTMILSALLWKKFNGPIRLVTDRMGHEYCKKHHLIKYYDEVLPILNLRNFGIDTKKYWASGKIQTLSKIHAPCAVIDLDLLVWKPLNCSQYKLAVTHSEPLSLEVYRNFEYFNVGNYQFPKNWSRTVEPLNTAIMYFGDETFKNYYVTQSVYFMQNELDTYDTGAICMCFAEQRILAMCAEEMNIKPHLFLDYNKLTVKNEGFTHLWSSKKVFKYNKDVEAAYCSLCQSWIEKLSFKTKGDCNYG